MFLLMTLQLKVNEKTFQQFLTFINISFKAYPDQSCQSKGEGCRDVDTSAAGQTISLEICCCKGDLYEQESNCFCLTTFSIFQV